MGLKQDCLEATKELKKCTCGKELKGDSYSEKAFGLCASCFGPSLLMPVNLGVLR